LDEREFELINILGQKLGSNQRDLARQMNLSLGMVNMLIRRLITKGYIRIEQLNQRKVQYILTSKGFSEKSQKSVKYTLNTINSLGLIKDRVKEIIQALYDNGQRAFYIFAENDLRTLIEWAFNEMKLPDCTYEVIKQMPEKNLNGTILIGYEVVPDNKYNLDNRVDLIGEISKDVEAFNV